MTIPGSTYRVQLHAGFTLRQLESIIDYLYRLGITTIYASPITMASSGSMHGYDVTDPLRINPEIGTIEDLERVAAKLREREMSWIQDIVPNHMAYEIANPWLWDVLERGPASPYFSYFDIDIQDSGDLTGNRLMAPFLDKTLTEALQAGEITLQCTPDGLRIHCNGQAWPVASGLYRWIVTMVDDYPPALWEIVKNDGELNWAVLLQDNPDWMRFLEMRAAFVNGKINLLEELLEHQHYVFTHYHLAASRINYRRFFTVNGLICLRMEEEVVFEAYHRMLKQLYDRGLIQGLRVDHIDGLASPKEYIDRLRRLFGADCYIIVEKILTGDERLPDDWNIQGATGYEFLAQVSRLLTDGAGVRSIEAFYRAVISEDMPDYGELVFMRKRNYLRKRMGGEWNNLTALLMRANPGYDREKLKEMLGVFMASMPVYRLYPERGALTEQEARYFQQAIGKVADREVFEKTIRDVRVGGRLMQFTGPLAAKGIEDTSFYIYNPLVSHNEVGDSPAEPAIAAGAFHRAMRERQARYPHALNAGTTHDTKRGEDSRIRLNYLSSIPEAWRDAVQGWMTINLPLVVLDDGTGRRIPSLNDEYFIYQSILGGFPSGMVATDEWRERVHGWLTKALREADTLTEYEHPDEGYEMATHAFVSAILETDSAFMESFIPFVFRVVRDSAVYSLSQLLLKLTAPGIPDIYQGSECWELSFVDPDNRLPVDYDMRESLLSGLEAAERAGGAAIREWLTAHERVGAAKLYMIRKVLHFRNAHPKLFSEGEYIPVDLGPAALAFKRRYGGEEILVIAPLMDGSEITLSEGHWINLLDDLTLGLCLYYASSGTDSRPGI